MGYARAGFTDIVGIDIRPQPRYPFRFIQGEALPYAAAQGHAFDLIHASPPCQAYSTITRTKSAHPDLYGATRQTIAHRPYVIENVIGAPYQHGIYLCGSMFDLPIWRHRNFETSWLILQPPCRHGARPFTITGKAFVTRATDYGHSRQCSFTQAQAIMGIDWMTRKELVQAIPPVYTTFIASSYRRSPP